MIRRRPAAPAAALAVALAFLVAACAPAVNAPEDRGVCWHMVHTKDGKYKFNRVADNVPNLETCMARLEALRLVFLSHGSNRYTISGDYQGQFIFINQNGIFSSQEVDGPQYPALVRSGDGRLVVPGSQRPQ